MNRSLFKEGRTGGGGGKLCSPNPPFRERKTPLRERLTKIQLNWSFSSNILSTHAHDCTIISSNVRFANILYCQCLFWRKYHAAIACSSPYYFWEWVTRGIAENREVTCLVDKLMNGNNGVDTWRLYLKVKIRKRAHEMFLIDRKGSSFFPQSHDWRAKT